jgi:dihydrofolate synthase/folylpolyglutamate synthase
MNNLYFDKYKEVTDYLFSQLPMYQRQGKAAYKADLDNTIKLMEVLAQPQNSFKSIHIAGTNGKGSTSHMLASVLQEAGYKVGLYTSPHLKDYRERIKINGQLIPEEYVIDFVNKYKSEFEKIGLSFFEWTVGLAFDYFNTEKIDIGIIEVGLGGRLDSTNVITPLISVITNIGKDHTQFLGDTYEKIAFEKAGIIKPNTPVVIGETQPETASVFKQIAKEKNAPIYFADQSEIKVPELDLKGVYQQKNCKTVISTLNVLTEYNKEFYLNETIINSGLKNTIKNTGLRGRWEILQHKPFIVTDTAHNKEGLQLVINQFTNLPHQNKHFILGFVNDKNVDEIIKLFPADANYYFTQPSIPRALSIENLKPIIKKTTLNAKFFNTPKEALEHVKVIANQQDIIYIGGSTFIVAEIL